MGVDLDEVFTPGDAANTRDGLIFVGRLVEKKGVEYLIEAMAILGSECPQLKLTVVGDGPLSETLKALAQTRGVSDRVRFLGSVRNEEVPGYLRAAAIFVMPSVVAESGDQEGLGLVAVEAQGCGCAVVASDLPAVRDTVIDGQTGLMARPADAADLAEKIALLLEDNALRKILAETGRNHALERFNWTAVGSRYAGIIRDRMADS
jgi:glycosyltransferase involved in cell wall biosynthesis